MTTTVCAAILFVLFTLLSGLHCYWLLGGNWGLKQAIPTKTEVATLPPLPKTATLLVALILLAFGGLYLIKSGVFVRTIPSWMDYAYWGIPSLFIARALGDFRYVGFFKKIKNTTFAKADTRLFSPLCLLIGTLGIIIQFQQ